MGDRPASLVEGHSGPWRRTEWLIEPLAIFVITRLALILLSWLALGLLPEAHGYSGGLSAPSLVNAWAHWDSGWYLSIVKVGYTLDPDKMVGSVAFFPLYPLLARGLSSIVGDQVVAGILVSNACLAAAVCVLYDLVASRFGRDSAQRATLLLLVFPYGFFLSAVYTESLFLLTAVTAFSLAERDRWWLAGLTGMLCCLTRQVGIILVPALGLLYLRRCGWSLRRVRPNVLSLLLIPLGLALYMAFLYWRFSDPLAFYHATVFGWKHFGLFGGELARLNPLSFRVGSYDLVLALNLLVTTLSIFAAVPIFRLLGPSYAAFTLFGALIPLSVGLESLGRYVAVLFPVFVLLGCVLRSRLAFNLLAFVSAVWMTLLAALFFNAYWVV